MGQCESKDCAPSSGYRNGVPPPTRGRLDCGYMQNMHATACWTAALPPRWTEVSAPTGSGSGAAVLEL